MKNIDYTMYYVTDSKLLSEKHNLFESIELAILGGATLIQLREKDISTKDFYEKALKVKQICDKYNIPLIINDRVDIALATDANGVHLGQEDMPLKTARKLLGNDKIIGISAHTMKEAVQAQKDTADYIGVGAMYATSTKTDTDIVSIDKLAQIKSELDIPVVAIGGINKDTIPSLYPAMVDGLAIVSAISMSDDTTLATRNLKNLFLKQYKTQAVIFDIDGTLVETMDIWDNAIKNLMRFFEFEYSKEDLKSVWNMEFIDSAKYTIEKFNLKCDTQSFLKKLKELSIEEYKKSDIRLKKGVLKLLNFLKQNNIKLAVASSLGKSQYETVLEKIGIKDYFDIICSSVDLGTKKSERFIFKQISKNLNINCKNMVFFEDDINSATGAKKAGVKLCTLFNKKYENDKRYDNLIDFRVNDFEDEIIYNDIIIV